MAAINKTKRLHLWLLRQPDWIYLNEVPYKEFDLSREAAHETLTRLCNTNRADFRIMGLKQYKGKQHDKG